jgi:hypothetical protein
MRIVSGYSLRRKVCRLEALLRARQNHLPALVRLRQDPLRAMTAAGLVPDSWQEQLLHSQAERLLLLCSRQAGKSTIAAALAVRTAVLQPAAPILLLSPSFTRDAASAA